MPKQVTITPEVRTVLALATVEEDAPFGHVLKLNQPGLARPLYEATNKVLVALGGKWNRSAQGHVFSGDIAPELASALAAGVAVDQKRTNEQFFTPLAVAEMVWERASLDPGHRVLEPSAGGGNLLNAPLRLGCDIVCVEQDGKLADLLRPLRVTVHHANFLDWSPAPGVLFDRVLMNPPFSRSADVLHVQRALSFLRPGGVLVAVMSPHWRFADDTLSRAFRHLTNQHGYFWEPLPPSSFRSAGTDVNTGILTCHKGDH